MITKTVAEHEVVLCVAYTTLLDYDSIVVKREGYGPIGNGVHGLTKRDLYIFDEEISLKTIQGRGNTLNT